MPVYPNRQILAVIEIEIEHFDLLKSLSLVLGFDLLGILRIFLKSYFQGAC